MTADKEQQSRTFELMRAAIAANPAHPESILFQAALRGMPLALIPAQCPDITPMPGNAIAMLLDAVGVGPGGFADQAGLRRLLASAVHLEAWDCNATTEQAIRFVGAAYHGVAVVACTTPANVEAWERLMAEYRPHPVTQ